MQINPFRNFDNSQFPKLDQESEKPGLFDLDLIVDEDGGSGDDSHLTGGTYSCTCQGSVGCTATQATCECTVTCQGTVGCN